MSHFLMVGPVGSGKSVVAQFVVSRLLRRVTPEAHPSTRMALRRRLAALRRQRNLFRHRQLKKFSIPPLHGARLTWRSVIWRWWRAGRLPEEVAPWESIYSTIAVTSPDGAPVVRQRPETWWERVRCGILFLDELQLYLFSRAFKDLNAGAMEFLTRHRHYDSDIVSTTQHIAFIDKIARILVNEVWLVRIWSVPLVGWLFPGSVRPPEPCAHALPHQQHSRRDAQGDWNVPWRRALGFGTIIAWAKYDPSIIGESESLDETTLETQGIVPRGMGVMLFNMRWANAARATTIH